MGLLNAIKVDVDDFEKRLSDLDVRLNTLNRIKSDYESLKNRMRENITSEDSDAYQKLEERATYQIKALEANIAMAQATRGSLAKVVQEGKDNGNLVNGIWQDSIDTVKNTVDTAVDAAKTAAAVASVAAVL